MGLTERHWFENEDVPENYEWALEDAVFNTNAIMQEAVKPINSYGIVRCGNCRNIVGYNDGYGRGFRNNYCSDCGKAVKWE